MPSLSEYFRLRNGMRESLYANLPPCRKLSHNQAALTSQTFFMFVFLNSWPEFSNTRAHKKGQPATSLEGIHNGIHNLSGGGGHMSDVSLAGAAPDFSALVLTHKLTMSGLGFDPIFYMHHANVDRLLSLWAALYPGVWVTEDKEVDGTFDIPSNTVVDGNTCKPSLPRASARRP